MHLERPHLTTTKYSGKGKKLANTAAQREAQAKHEAYLKKQGLDKETLAKRKANIKPKKLVRETPVTPKPALSNTIVDGGRKFSIMDLVFGDEETEETKKAILNKASRTAPLYNKGGYQYVSDGEDLTQIGNKSRR